MNLLEKLKVQLSNTQSKINLVKCDLSNTKEIEQCVRESIKKYGCPSVLINNAGCAFNGDLIEMDLEKWEQIIQVNLTSVFQMCSLIVPEMRKNGGLIINVSSHASYKAFPQWGAYCASKAALASFTRCLAEEERINRIRACTLTLGSVNTTLWDADTVQSDFDRNSMLSAECAASALLHLSEQPATQVIEDLTLMPAKGAF